MVTSNLMGRSGSRAKSRDGCSKSRTLSSHSKTWKLAHVATCWAIYFDGFEGWACRVRSRPCHGLAGSDLHEGGTWTWQVWGLCQPSHPHTLCPPFAAQGLTAVSWGPRTFAPAVWVLGSQSSPQPTMLPLLQFFFLQSLSSALHSNKVPFIGTFWCGLVRHKIALNFGSLLRNPSTNPFLQISCHPSLRCMCVFLYAKYHEVFFL